MDKNIQYFENEELGLGMYVIPAIGLHDLLYNYNDLCDMLNLPDTRRRKWLKKLPDEPQYRIRITFKRDGRDSEETFITTPSLIEVLNRFGKELLDMLERKNSVENFIFDISQQFEKQYVENDEISIADKFVLGSLSYDAEFTNQTNKNLVNLLKKNETIETIWKHHPDINMNKDEDIFNKEVEEFIKMLNDIEDVVDNLNNKIKSSMPDWLGDVVNCRNSVMEEYEDLLEDNEKL